MAICKNCKKDVGCGCNLTNGLCSKCLSDQGTTSPRKKKKGKMC